MPGREVGPLKQRTKVLDIILLWVVFGSPLMVGMWFWIGWYFLLVFAVLVWATWNYYRKGKRVGATKGSHTESAIDQVRWMD